MISQLSKMLQLGLFWCVLVLIFESICCAHNTGPLCVDKSDNERFDCYPVPGASKERCEARGCCWKGTPVYKVPWCYYPDNYGGYKLINQTKTDKGQLAYFSRTFPSPYPRDIQTVRLDVEYQTETRLRVKLSDARAPRYEALYPKINKNFPGTKNPLYKFELDANKTGFKVMRNDGDVIFDSQNVGGLILADQFLQISSIFKGQIYGLGEHRTTFWLDINWQKYTLFTHDAAPTEGVNLYGSHPFYLVMQPSGKSYGVFLHNSNAIDVILQPLPAITFRAIGGILDFYFFTGPTPAEVIRQYTELIGRSFMPPYWSLGFHLSKYGYGSEKATRAIWERNRNAGIPFDVMWNDIDYMKNNNDFTVDDINFANLPKLISEIHAAGMHYVPILDPGVSASEPKGTYPPYEDGIAMDIFVKDHKGDVFIGKVWNPNTTAFPDFTNPKTEKFWTKHIRQLHKALNFDGLWIDMNEPANFWDGGINGCPDSELEEPPYLPGVDGGMLRKKTICMTAKQYAGLHYNLHNLYGISEQDMTYKALKDVIGKRVFSLSRSSFSGSGSYGGHWSGDVYSSWHDLTKSVPEMLSYSLFGMAYTGADICGFNGNATKSLCNRWMQLGAFYPFSRNHNSIDCIHQDPVAFGDDVIKSSIKALTIRYFLLPYLYTLFYRAHVFGDTVVRPLFFEFPMDENTYTVDRSFLWGSGFYVVPVTEDHSTHVWTYLPEGKWYDWYTGDVTMSQGQNIKLNAPLDTIPLLVRGGTILPAQEPAQVTTLSRRNPFVFMAFADRDGLAKGSLFWDDGDSLGIVFNFSEQSHMWQLIERDVGPGTNKMTDFIDTIETKKYGLLELQLFGNSFQSVVNQWNTPEMPLLGKVIIHGFARSITKVLVNGKETEFILKNNVLTVHKMNSSLSQNILISWS